MCVCVCVPFVCVGLMGSDYLGCLGELKPLCRYAYQMFVDMPDCNAKCMNW